MGDASGSQMVNGIIILKILDILSCARGARFLQLGFFLNVCANCDDCTVTFAYSSHLGCSSHAPFEIRAAKSKSIIFCGGYTTTPMHSAPSYSLSSCINAHAAGKAFG